MKILGTILLFLICSHSLFAQIDSLIRQSKIDTIVKGSDSLTALKDTLILDSTIKLESMGSFRLKPNSKVRIGIASFYSKNLDGTKTATGEYYRNAKLTAASNNFKLNTWVKVTNISNNKFVIVRINDRMHPRMARKGRVVDLSRAAAKELDFMKKGLTRVKVEPIERISVD